MSTRAAAHISDETFLSTIGARFLRISKLFANLVFFYEHIAAQVVEKIVHAGFVARERVVVIEAINLHLPQVQLVAGEYSARIDILWQLLGC